MKSIRQLVILGALTPVVASAQVIPIGEFVGAMSDSYETQPRHTFLPSYDILGDGSTVDQVGAGQGLHITTGWGFFSTIFPHSGEVFMGGAGVNYEFNFASPVVQFGGWFGTNADAPDAMATFYDAGGVQIGDPLVVSAPLGEWAWNGWEYAGGLSRIVVIANNQYNGFIMSDDIQANPVPEPGSIVAVALGLGLLAARRRR